MTDAVLHSARPTPVPALLNPALLAATLWRHRDLIRQFGLRYFHQRYRGTHLGMVWALLFPLMLLLIYTVVFSAVLSARFEVVGEEPRSHYAVLLFCGITVYTIFSEIVVRSCSLVIENPSYVKKVVFPIEILPVAQAYATLLFSLFGIALVGIATILVFGRVPWTAFLYPLVLFPLLPLALGLGWFFASLSVFLRDVGNFVTIVVSSMLIFLTPVFFSMDHLPEEWRAVAAWNPLAPIVDGARKVLVIGVQPDWRSLGIVLIVGLVAAQLGFAWFMKSKRGFADVL